MTDETVITWRDWLRGCRRSLTVWVSVAVIALPDLVALAISQFATLAPFIPVSLQSRALSVLGLIMLLLRFKTTASLAHR